jgi:hypothetical protein
MTRALGFVGLLLVLGVGAFIYKQQLVSTSVSGASAANPRSTVDIIGVKNDLIAIAEAERRHLASEGTYVSIGDLIDNGDISMKSPSRGPYTYSADVEDNAFQITATYSGDDPRMPKTLTIDQTLEIKTE